MNRSILWNGFELKKGFITTSAGDVPYIMYSPEISVEPVTIAIHKETGSKDDWLCFNSVLKEGNLLKESIRNNSPFIAFDMYGHGDWTIEDKGFNPSSMSPETLKDFTEKSAKGISEAIIEILKKFSLDKNPITIVGNSMGCSIALNLDLNGYKYKSILISPYNTQAKSSATKFLIFRGNNDSFVKEEDFKKLLEELPEDSEIVLFKAGHDLNENWINNSKEFIYSNSRVG